MVTQKDFKAIAEIISKTANKVYQTTHTKNLTERLANYFATQNPRFVRERFLRACEL